MVDKALACGQPLNYLLLKETEKIILKLNSSKVSCPTGILFSIFLKNAIISFQIKLSFPEKPKNLNLTLTPVHTKNQIHLYIVYI